MMFVCLSSDPGQRQIIFGLRLCFNNVYEEEKEENIPCRMDISTFTKKKISFDYVVVSFSFNST